MQTIYTCFRQEMTVCLIFLILFSSSCLSFVFFAFTWSFFVKLFLFLVRFFVKLFVFFVQVVLFVLLFFISFSFVLYELKLLCMASYLFLTSFESKRILRFLSFDTFTVGSCGCSLLLFCWL